MRNAELSYSAKRWDIGGAGSVRVVLIFSLTLYKWCAIAVNLQRLAAMLRRCRIQKSVIRAPSHRLRSFSSHSQLRIAN